MISTRSCMDSFWLRSNRLLTRSMEVMAEAMRNGSGNSASRASSVGRRKSAGMGITLTGVAWVTLKNCSCMEAIPCCHRRFPFIIRYLISLAT